MSSGDEEARFRVLFVCTANRCRSPMMEYLLRAKLDQEWLANAWRWQVRSAALQGEAGRRIERPVLSLLAERGIDASEFRSSILTHELTKDSDLILTATRAQRGRVVTVDASALTKTFTLTQFGYLLADSSPAKARTAIEAGYETIERAARARTMLLGRTNEDDLFDPIGKSNRVFKKCAARIDGAITQIVSALPQLE